MRGVRAVCCVLLAASLVSAVPPVLVDGEPAAPARLLVSAEDAPRIDMPAAADVLAQISGEYSISGEFTIDETVQPSGTFQLGDEADACSPVWGWIEGYAGPVGDAYDCAFTFLEEALTNPDAAP